VRTIRRFKIEGLWLSKVGGRAGEEKCTEGSPVTRGCPYTQSGPDRGWQVEEINPTPPAGAGLSGLETSRRHGPGQSWLELARTDRSWTGDGVVVFGTSNRLASHRAATTCQFQGKPLPG
jgi:hypothetical protein